MIPKFRAHIRFKHPIQGIVQKVYDNSILGKITVVHREDKENISDSNNQMIISKKYVLNQIKTKKVEEFLNMRKNYRLIYKQCFMGEELQDTIMKYNKTIAEMEQSVNDLYSDPHVFSVRYEEVQNE